MRFCVDAHAIGRNLTGNEVYVRNLLKGFAAQDGQSEFIAYISEAGAERELPERFQWRRVSANPFVRLGYQMNRHLAQDRADLVHVQYTAPIRCRVPVVVSVHDVSYLEHPEYFPPARVAQLKMTVSRTVRRAACVIAPSEFSARRIRDAYGVGEDRIRAVPIAVSSAFRPLPQDMARGQVRERFGVGHPYVLMVGDLQPRKNQTGLIHAFEQLLRTYPDLPHRLVLAGKDSWYADRIRAAAAASAVAERIVFTGPVSDAELLSLYNGCDLFVFPSHYEGFGLPILEAMACGRAVACSNATAMLEVADSAGLVFNPESTVEMVRAMADLLLDAELRSRMERLGLQHAHSFRWEETARKTLAIYYEVAERLRGRTGAVVAGQGKIEVRQG
ncbi:MAG: glycosyltransferase family 1 protein [Bryobacteraceae bacterium]